MREGRIGRALIAFTALGFAALLAAGLAVMWAAGKAEEYTGWVNHTNEVRVAIGEAEALVERGETSRRGFLLAGRSRYLLVYDETRRRLGPIIDRIATLTADNPRQQRRVALLRRAVAEMDAGRSGTLGLMAAGRVADARAAFVAEGDVDRLRAIRVLLADLEADETTLLGRRGEDQRSITRIFYILLAVAGCVLVLVAIASLLTFSRYARDLAASGDRLRALNETLEEQVAARTADLTLANEEIQRFAYIVSHDLRSPLVNVMGFTAELSAAATALAGLIDRAEADAPAVVTEEARLAAREDLPEAIGFIRASTAKMDRLINAILQLSRQGRRTLSPEPLDLAELADGVVAAIRHVIDERGAEAVVERPMPTVVGDRLAVEQILSNLVENATKYLKPGRPGRIVVAARQEGARAIVSVSDNGRGVDPRDHQRIFDLFRRSGAQDQPGEGIGLAHVRALAYRLGGAVTVRSTLGEGSTFSLSLPLRPDQQEASR